MKTRTNQQIISDSGERISQIAEILLNGIRRLEEREKAENPHNKLASKSSPSLYNTGSTVINNQNHVL